MPAADGAHTGLDRGLEKRRLRGGVGGADGGSAVGRAWTAGQPVPGPASSAIQMEIVARQMVDTVM